MCDNAGGPTNLGCCPYIQLFKGGKLICTATPPDADSTGGGSSISNNKGVAGKLQLKWVKASEGCVSFTVDCAVQGDILLRCRHAASNGQVRGGSSIGESDSLMRSRQH